MMSNKPQLPALKKGGDQIAELTIAVGGAALDHYLPVFGTALAQIGSHFIRRKMERSQEILIEHIRQGNIEIISDDQYAAYIPISFRFFSAAQEGASENKIKLLAKIIRGHFDKPIQVDTFVRISRKLEYLSDFDIEFIGVLHSIERAGHFVKDERLGFKNRFFPKIIERNSTLKMVEILESVNNLTASGLIYGKADVVASGGHYYYLTSDFHKLCETALSRSP